MFPVRRIFCVGRNYAEHAREMGATEQASGLEPGNPLYSAIAHVDTAAEEMAQALAPETAFVPEVIQERSVDAKPADQLILDEPHDISDDAPLEFELPPVQFSPPEPVLAQPVEEDAPYVDTFVTAETLPDDGEALDFDLASVSSGVSSLVQPAEFAVGSLAQRISLDEPPESDTSFDDDELSFADDLPEFFQ